LRQRKTFYCGALIFKVCLPIVRPGRAYESRWLVQVSDDLMSAGWGKAAKLLFLRFNSEWHDSCGAEIPGLFAAAEEINTILSRSQ
jgi:hypothetical protein